MDGLNERIVINVEKHCAWCELPGGSFLYGRDKAEIEKTLDMLAKKARHGLYN